MSLGFAVKKADFKKVRSLICPERCHKCMIVTIFFSYYISLNPYSPLVHTGLHQGDTEQ